MAMMTRTAVPHPEIMNDTVVVVSGGDGEEGFELYSDAQNRMLSAIPTITGLLSLLGSSLIIYVIWKERHKLLKNSYDRIMLGLSVFDAVSSFGFVFFGPWAIAEEVPFVVGARAPNFTWCEVSGWLANLQVGSILYTTSLMIYFMLQIKLEWSPDRIAKRVEPWLHGISILVAIGTSSYGVAKEYMNPIPFMPGVCWIASYPPGCDVSNIPDSCLRGDGATSYMRGVASIVFVTIFILVVTMVTLIAKVRSTELRMMRYDSSRVLRRPPNIGGRRQPPPPPQHEPCLQEIGVGAEGGESSHPIVRGLARPTSSSILGRRRSARTTSSTACFERTRRTSKRGLAYIGGFFLCFVIPVSFFYILVEHPIKNQLVLFFISVLLVTVVPLQGFLNAIIYLRPKWKELRKNDSLIQRVSQGLSLIRRVFCCCRCQKQAQEPVPCTTSGSGGSSSGTENGNLRTAMKTSSPGITANSLDTTGPHLASSSGGTSMNQHHENDKEGDSTTSALPQLLTTKETTALDFYSVPRQATSGLPQSLVDQLKAQGGEEILPHHSVTEKELSNELAADKKKSPGAPDDCHDSQRTVNSSASERTDDTAALQATSTEPSLAVPIAVVDDTDDYDYSSSMFMNDAIAAHADGNQHEQDDSGNNQQPSTTTRTKPSTSLPLIATPHDCESSNVVSVVDDAGRVDSRSQQGINRGLGKEASLVEGTEFSNDDSHHRHLAHELTVTGGTLSDYHINTAEEEIVFSCTASPRG